MSKCRYCKLCGWANDGDKDFFGWCEIHLESYDTDEPRDCPDYIQASNADRLRVMSDEELANEMRKRSISTICDIVCQGECKAIATLNKTSNEVCKEIIMKWLQQPAEEDT